MDKSKYCPAPSKQHLHSTHDSALSMIRSMLEKQDEEGCADMCYESALSALQHGCRSQKPMGAQRLKLAPLPSSLGFYPVPTEEQVKQFVFSTGGSKGRYDAEQNFVDYRFDKTRRISESKRGLLGTSWRSNNTVRPDEGKKMDITDADPTSKPAFGCFCWKETLDWDPAKYVKVNTGAKKQENPHLLRFYVERVWGLKRPQVLISVTGGASEFDLTTYQKDKLLYGMMDTAKSVDVWFVTGGSAAGIMKYMGEARARYAVHVPLIGVATWGSVMGREHLRKNTKTEGEYFEVVKSYDEAAKSELLEISHDPSKKPARLDENHTHFIFADDGTTYEFSKETLLRSAFEACVAGGDSYESKIVEMLKDKGLGWHGTNLKESKKQDNSQSAIPVVCVCVQGGPGTIWTVLHALENSTPALLARGTGKAADLLSDAVLLKFTEGHVMHQSNVRMLPNMRALNHFISRHIKVTHVDDKKCRDYSRITLRNEHEKEARAVLELYDMHSRDFPAVLILQNVLKAAQYKTCWVYDLNDPNPDATDFSGSLLRCLINGRGWEDEKEADQDKDGVRNLLEEKLKLAIMWNRRDILELTLKNTVIKREDPQSYREVIQRVLQHALVHNRVDMVKMLQEFGATLAQYHVLPLNGTRRVAGAGKPAIDLWKELVQSYKADLQSGHVFSFFREVKDNVMFKVEQRDLDGGGTTQIEVAAEQQQQSPNQQHNDKQRAKRHTAPSRVKSTRYHSLVLPEKNRKRIKLLEMTYIDLLGPSLQYRIGSVTPSHDLFLWSVLMNRHDMAMLFWRQCSHPVRSALTAAFLYRSMSNRFDVEPVIKAQMKTSADMFEEVAIGVQKAALEEHMALALATLECPLPIWRRITMMDLAVMSGSDRFVETCCREALERRFAGDLHPYGQGFGPVRKLKNCCVLSMCTLGLVAPFIIRYNPPPRSNIIRYPTQRRVLPKGFPDRPLENPVLKAIRDSPKAHTTYATSLRWMQKLEQDHAGTMIKMSDVHLNELWEPAFSYWQKLGCFWRAPVVLYLSNAFVQTFFAVFFTFFLTNDDVFDPEGLYEEGISSKEIGIGCYFLGSTATEAVQVLIEGPVDYINDFWNLIDVGAVITFWSAFAVRVHCSQDHCAWLGGERRAAGGSAGSMSTTTAIRREVEAFNLAKQLYGLSIFFLYTRLLRILSVNKTLGPLVLIFKRMGYDTLVFGLMFLVLCMAFSVAMFGSNISPEPHFCVGDGLDPVACWQNWWIVRTYFQAMGEFYLEEMTTNPSIFILIMLYVVMQLILVNLLIAMMSSTYTEIKQMSNRQWLMDLYVVTREFTRLSTAVPAPLNILSMFADLLIFFWRKQNIDHLYRGFTFPQKLERHLSRNKGILKAMKESGKMEKAQDERERLKLEAFMERARGKYLKAVSRSDHDTAAKVVHLEEIVRGLRYDITQKLDHIIEREHERRQVKRSSTLTSHAFPLDARGLEPVFPIDSRERVA